MIQNIKLIPTSTLIIRCTRVKIIDTIISNWIHNSLDSYELVYNNNIAN